jgi:hypothetical protein
LQESVIATEFQAKEAYSSLDLTKAKNGINRLRRNRKMSQFDLVNILKGNKDFKK